MTDVRPDPEALLVLAQAAEPRSRGGRLKIFFGMCAGVGKTYAMLQEALERRRAGIDVVAGYIETHGRPETDALARGLEELPPRWVDYRGLKLRELDLDAALTRKPALLLVDELAHTNAEGLRHAKRWRDVLELLDAGIDVYTTVNVQHIESLNDVVARITGTTVRETVPDAVLERADEIELVDTPPDDLLQRLREGKVYVADQARRAITKFFRRDNLVALRELALREMAQRVGAEVQIERAMRGELRPWPTSERILACVGPSPLSARLIRRARRMAAAARAEWFAVSVETPGQTESTTAQVRRNLDLAERLGAETVVLTGEAVADEILAYAMGRNVTKILVGKPALPRWRERLLGGIVDDLIRRGGDIDIHVVKGERPEARESVLLQPPRRFDWRAYGWTLAVLAACTALASVMFGHVSAVNLTMVYLAGVVLVASRFTLGPSILASVLAALLFDFLFTEPYYSFAISDVEYVIAFLVLLVTALVISGLTQQVRRQVDAARTRYLRTLALYFMSRKLAAAADVPGLARFSAQHVAEVFGGETAVLLPDASGTLAVADRQGAFAVESANEQAVARWVFEHQQSAGWSTETLSAAQAIYLPLVASGRSFGVLALRPRQAQRPLEADEQHLLDTFGTQLAIALERAALAAQAQAAQREAETEQVRSALLSCVSHDLRTPLAAIAGTASTLLDPATRLDAVTGHQLLQSIADEAERLNQLVGKLLDMTRLESAGFRPRREPYPLDELVGTAVTRLGTLLREHRVETHIPEDLPLLHVDGPLLGEVFTNLLENAARYTPAGSWICVRAAAAPPAVVVEVLDDGPGLPPGSEREIFRRFVRRRPAGDRSGTGLGLAICEAVIRLHGGRIAAENRPEGGARFWFTLPLGSPAAAETPRPAGSATATPAPGDRS